LAPDKYRRPSGTACVEADQLHPGNEGDKQDDREDAIPLLLITL
jgi:hypothetical protein